MYGKEGRKEGGREGGREREGGGGRDMGSKPISHI